MPVVFCKPDALQGPHSTVGGRRAAGFFAALAAQCAGDGPESLVEPWRTGAERAAIQIAERARTEEGFRGTLVGPECAAERLRQAGRLLWSGPEPTWGVLRRAVRQLGFEVEAERRLILGKRGVEAVYAGATTTVQFGRVRAELVDYLASDPIEVWLLSGRQAACALQWWKTYVRHMLLDCEPGEYLLRNLVHVCDGPDAGYLAGLVRG
ncbi:hypothetical protein [Streptomyces sp. NPDC088258]|uniref:hypothetical protein n=1 Tax=Streptomyces sp. NPDC088258 TaxID=3365849 RepID=UPI00382C681F